MNKFLSILTTLILLLMLAGCQNKTPVVTQINDSTDEKLSQIVAKNLSIPDGADITYEISETFYWDAGECYYKHICFYENGKAVAYASVNPDTGELLKNIRKYEQYQ